MMYDNMYFDIVHKYAPGKTNRETYRNQVKDRVHLT